MKLITAIINHEVLNQVHQALIDSGIGRITVSRCAGHGRQEDLEFYRGKEVTPSLIPKVRIDIACNEDFVKSIVETILATARRGETGEGVIGDGKIFVTTLDECYRIRTGESGEEAI